MTYFDDETLFDYLADQHDSHARATSWWQFNSARAIEAAGSLRLFLVENAPFRLGPLDDLRFSFRQMGSINSLDLFGLDELLLFSYYWRNRKRYRNVVDLGANIGLHSILLGKMGMRVTSYEPDPSHMAELRANMAENGLPVAGLRESAVNVDGLPVEFVRVVGNTTGSHIAGAKSDPYGELERFTVKTTPIADAVADVDLVKMDVEGFEATLLEALPNEAFAEMDIIAEIGTPENARRIFKRFHETSVYMFTQKTNWQAAQYLGDLPTSHREGSVFLTVKSEMYWDKEPKSEHA